MKPKPEKRKYSTVRSSSAEPDLIPTKRLLISQGPAVQHTYKTISSEFFTKEMIGLDDVEIHLSKD